MRLSEGNVFCEVAICFKGYLYEPLLKIRLKVQIKMSSKSKYTSKSFKEIHQQVPDRFWIFSHKMM